MKMKFKMRRLMKRFEEGYEEYSMPVFYSIILGVGTFLGLSCFGIREDICALVAMLPALVLLLVAIRIIRTNMIFITAVEFQSHMDMTETKYYNKCH